MSGALLDVKSNGRSALDALTELRVAGKLGGRQPLASGFSPLDEVLGGGFRPEDLVVLGGKPGQGKTIAALQWAREMAAAGATCIFACYEHDETTLLARMLTSDLAEAAAARSCRDRLRLDGLRRSLRAVAAGEVGLHQILDWDPLLVDAEARFATSAGNLILTRASGTRTDVGQLRQIVEQHRSEHTVLFVDYVQKVPVTPEPADEEERVKRVVDHLKEMGLDMHVAVVALTAADRAGLEARRLRVQHFRGAASLAYEADVVIVLNPKLDIVSRAHLAYDTTRAAEFRRKMVLTIEKNRHGAADVDLEFVKDFESYRFNPVGGFVVDRLWSESSLEE